MVRIITVEAVRPETSEPGNLVGLRQNATSSQFFFFFQFPGRAGTICCSTVLLGIK